jgi:hypothetical protein
LIEHGPLASPRANPRVCAFTQEAKMRRLTPPNQSRVTKQQPRAAIAALPTSRYAHRPRCQLTAVGAEPMKHLDPKPQIQPKFRCGGFAAYAPVALRSFAAGSFSARALGRFLSAT